MPIFIYSVCYEQAIIERLANLDVKFTFGVDYWFMPGADINKIKFKLNGRYVKQREYLAHIRKFLVKNLRFSSRKGMRFARWLSKEMLSYIGIYENKDSAFATFTTNRGNLNQHNHGQYWHGDTNAYVGIKNYVGKGTLYAQKKATRINKNYDSDVSYSDDNCFLNVDKRYSLYQLQAQGVNLHKGGRTTHDNIVGAVHRSPQKLGCDKPRVILLFGVTN